MFLPKHGLEFHRFVSRVVNVYKILEAGDHLASLAAGFQPAFLIYLIYSDPSYRHKLKCEFPLTSLEPVSSNKSQEN